MITDYATIIAEVQATCRRHQEEVAQRTAAALKRADEVLAHEQARQKTQKRSNIMEVTAKAQQRSSWLPKNETRRIRQILG